jgi:hypothetical protein
MKARTQRGQLTGTSEGFTGTISDVNALSTEIYDPVANTWSSAASLLSPPVSRFIAPLLPSGEVLVADDGNGSAELYDSTTNAWSATTNLITARFDFAATLLQSGEVLVAGGDPVIPNNTNAPLTSAELYP